MALLTGLVWGEGRGREHLSTGLRPQDKQVPAKGRITGWGDGFRGKKAWQGKAWGSWEQDTCRGSAEGLMVQLEHGEIGGPEDGLWGQLRDREEEAQFRPPPGLTSQDSCIRVWGLLPARIPPGKEPGVCLCNKLPGRRHQKPQPEAGHNQEPRWGPDLKCLAQARRLS